MKLMYSIQRITLTIKEISGDRISRPGKTKHYNVFDEYLADSFWKRQSNLTQCFCVGNFFFSFKI